MIKPNRLNLRIVRAAMFLTSPFWLAIAVVSGAVYGAAHAVAYLARVYKLLWSA